jgi:hypothetical protein
MSKSAPRPVVSALRNTGWWVLNAEREMQPERTLVVIGLARSGTSMVAGALHKLGVPMGPKENVVYEDVALAKALESRDDAAARRLIAERNAAYPVWGIKRPGLLPQLERIEGELRNPEYIVTFRDLFAIANRNRLSVFSEVLANMEESLKQYQQVLRFLSRCQRRVLLLSYEKAMARPLFFVAALARFAGIDDEEAKKSARAFVRLDPPDYLVSAREVHVRGVLERADAQRVCGWAFRRGEAMPVDVMIRLNGRRVARVAADQPHAAIADQPHAACGFVWTPPARYRIGPGDVVTASVVGERQDLGHSPLVVAALKKGNQ